ncbi:hypothetical protein DSCO28_40410 [Desulfosarcina ovata subsp. sediminis]|uniref:Uncharacterized protein n=1 Tax=Desulfosarcina ovata subsp. sediminis TaxID=885957 RepID=A0A5K7ZTE5_9BACT|nr:hypothetical protein DSCO28_40410 [Desulfosarcina ovata subsp. sediminis]
MRKSHRLDGMDRLFLDIRFKILVQCIGSDQIHIAVQKLAKLMAKP